MDQTGVNRATPGTVVETRVIAGQIAQTTFLHEHDGSRVVRQQAVLKAQVRGCATWRPLSAATLFA
jgi:hypothetical protein